MRVNLEEEAWKRIYKMADLMSVSVYECAGVVVCLWANSQDLVRVSGTLDEILEWSAIFKLPRESSEKFVEALKKVRFISLQENGEYLIHGNEKQLEAIASKASRASKGGKALQKKMKELRKLKAGLKQTSSSPEEAKRGSIQFNSRHYNSIQFNSKVSAPSEFSTEPIFQFLEKLDKDNVTLEPNLIKHVIRKIHDDIHPRKAKGSISGIVEGLSEALTSVDGLKWLLFATWSFRNYCVEKRVEKVIGFERFAGEWTNWIPKKYQEGA